MWRQRLTEFPIVRFGDCGRSQRYVGIAEWIVLAFDRPLWKRTVTDFAVPPLIGLDGHRLNIEKEVRLHHFSFFGRMGTNPAC